VFFVLIESETHIVSAPAATCLRRVASGCFTDALQLHIKQSNNARKLLRVVCADLIRNAHCQRRPYANITQTRPRVVFLLLLYRWTSCNKTITRRRTYALHVMPESRTHILSDFLSATRRRSVCEWLFYCCFPSAY